MAIRQLLSEDASAFQTLRLAELLECAEAFTSSHAEEVETPLGVVAGRLADNSDGAVFGHFVGNRAVGIIGVQREARRKLSHKAFIWGMYVAPEQRLKGIGRALLAHTIDHAARNLGVLVVNLGVNTQSTAAIALYGAMGFEIYGTELSFIMIDGIAHDQHLMRRHVHGVS